MDLTTDEIRLLKWIGEDDYAQYGECHGKTLNSLFEKGLAQLHGSGQHQAGFIAQDNVGARGDMYRAVSLTKDGIVALRDVKSN